MKPWDVFPSTPHELTLGELAEYAADFKRTQDAIAKANREAKKAR